MKVSSISGVKSCVNDIEKTSQFYESIGFRISNQTDSSVTCYVNWFWVTFVVADSEQGSEDASKGAGQVLYIKVADVNEFYQGVMALGLKPESEPYDGLRGGKEFVLRDPDGHKLAFFDK